MPELPDVQGFRRHFNRHAAGKRVRGVEVLDRALVRNARAPQLARALEGRELGRAERHGKWLIVPVRDHELLLHFGMTGLLAWSGDGGERHPHDRLELRLAGGGALRYRNMRRFGGIWLAEAGRREDATGPLGPDAMDLGRDDLLRLLRGRRGGVKAALMDQELLAGVGNILSDEVLWRARIDPRARTDRLSERRLHELHEALRETIRAANRRGRIPGDEDWLTGARDDPDGRCPRCGTKLRREKVAGRSAAWCPRCQRR